MSSAQSPTSSVKSPESSAQNPAFSVQNLVSRVQRREFSVQRPASRVQRLESNVQLLCPESRNSGMPRRLKQSYSRCLLGTNFDSSKYCIKFDKRKRLAVQEPPNSSLLKVVATEGSGERKKRTNSKKIYDFINTPYDTTIRFSGCLRAFFSRYITLRSKGATRNIRYFGKSFLDI